MAGETEKIIFPSPLYNINRMDMGNKQKRLSPFSAEFWIKKGLTPEEAEYKRNSIRPIRKEYWLERGYSEEESILKALEFKSNNNKKGGQKNAAKDSAEHRRSSVRCVEHWIDKGFSEDEALKKVKEIQSTFNIKKCIEKYGENEGRRIWCERQEKWQETLNSKTDEEKKRINSKKSIFSKILQERHEPNFHEDISKIYKSRGMKVVVDEQDFRKFLQELLVSKPYLKYVYYQSCLNHIPDIYWKVVGIPESDRKEYLTSLGFCVKLDKSYGRIVKSAHGPSFVYMMHTPCGKVLRSSHEIYFYHLLLERDIEFEIEKTYPNSNLKCDFYLPEFGYYIEICGTIGSQKYDERMKRKQELFGCYLLKNDKKYVDFLNDLLNGEKLKLEY